MSSTNWLTRELIVEVNILIRLIDRESLSHIHPAIFERGRSICVWNSWIHKQIDLKTFNDSSSSADIVNKDV